MKRSGTQLSRRLDSAPGQQRSPGGPRAPLGQSSSQHCTHLRRCTDWGWGRRGYDFLCPQSPMTNTPGALRLITSSGSDLGRRPPVRRCAKKRPPPRLRETRVVPSKPMTGGPTTLRARRDKTARIVASAASSSFRAASLNSWVITCTLSSDPSGIWTRVFGVRGRRPHGITSNHAALPHPREAYVGGYDSVGTTFRCQNAASQCVSGA